MEPLAYQSALFPPIPSSIIHKATMHLPVSITCQLSQLLPSPPHDPGTSLPFTTVASFVTCQLIRPCRHITSTYRLKTIIVLKQKRYQMLTASYPKEFYGSFSAIPTEEHLWVSKLRDFINSSVILHFHWGLDFSHFPPKCAADLSRAESPPVPHSSISWQTGQYEKCWCAPSPQYQHISKGH